MKLYGLIGKNLSYSFSKKYFSEKFERENISDCEYQLFQLDSIDNFSTLLTNNPHLAGINVTIPYKQSIISFLSESSKVVLESNACNCIKISDGRLIGFNTDVIGIEKSLFPYLKQYHTDALILGTAGASKAVQYVLKNAGISTTIVSRQPENNEISYQQISKDQIEKHKLIINCTPVGTYPDINEAPDLNYEFLGFDHLLFDLIYNPAKTLFLRKGEEKGATILNGMEMLEIQAESSWDIWNV